MLKSILLLGALSAALPVHAAVLDGTTLNLAWGIPFAGILLSIALFPLFAPNFWHHHFGKVAAGWAALFLIPLLATHGVDAAIHLLFHALILEYIPFIALLLSLYVTSSGIVFNNKLFGTPKTNVVILAIGTLIASMMGTTGAAMLLISPLLQANAERKYKTHTVIFFIFLVCNIGGALSPLGDPPLFLGFLFGVRFLWPLEALFWPTFGMSVWLLGLYYAIDMYLFKKENLSVPQPTEKFSLSLLGKRNIFFLAAIVLMVLISGIWKPGIRWTVLGTPIFLQSVVRDIALFSIAFIVFRTTPRENYIKNRFSWFPIIEVAKLFAAIFITIIPVLSILRAGTNGALSSMIGMVSDSATGEPINIIYFWLTGILSSFLDNAPTYLVFFNMAGGDPQLLMTTLAKTLTAISLGAVYMGANTYIGNAPNFMIRSIASEQKVNMPSFFGYMLWSGGILLPSYLILSLILF